MADTTLTQQGALFGEVYLPHKPLSSSHKAGAYRRRYREDALQLPYVEANPLVLQSLIITDRDLTDTDMAADLAGLPEPTYTALNPLTNTGHVVFGLKDPVCLTDAARRRPINLLARIEHGLNTVLEGDSSYGGRITKNPLHDEHKTLWGESLYSLQELASALDQLGALPSAGNPRKNVTSSAVGRNVALFDTVRKWSYRAIRQHWSAGLDAWQQAVLSQAYMVNEEIIGNEFTRGPLSYSEVRSVARSIARWTWRNMTPESFTARQRELGRRSALSGKSLERRRAKTRSLIEGALKHD